MLPKFEAIAEEDKYEDEEVEKETDDHDLALKNDPLAWEATHKSTQRMYTVGLCYEKYAHLGTISIEHLG